MTMYRRLTKGMTLGYQVEGVFGKVREEQVYCCGEGVGEECRWRQETG
jgi:hypothetical protein